MLFNRNNALLCLAFIFLQVPSVAGLDTKIKILVGSPVKQNPKILKEFLYSLRSTKQENIAIDYCFIDDNDNQESSKLLKEFSESLDANCSIYQSTTKDDIYVCDERTHYWSENLIWKVAEFKNFIINKAVDNNYDYLFLVDSDIVLHPATIEHLLSTGKDIISEVFWTRWEPSSAQEPQVWEMDTYTVSQSFLNSLRVPGVYEVGGLGTCTLISKKALEAGVNFSKIKNVSFRGEDRHFSVRAVAKEFKLYVDTHYPAYHVFRLSDLEGLDRFKIENGLKELESSKKPRITLAMCVKNEADKYLRRVLESAREYIDEAVIIDDASTDSTPAICLDILKDIPVHIIRNVESKFSHEIDLRRQMWSEVVKTDPDWILVLDADQIFEDKFKDEIQYLINRDDVDVINFRLYDFWDEEHYREDPYWEAHKRYKTFMVRYKKDFNYVWADNQMTPQHCGSFPANVLTLPGGYSQLRVKHYGWAKHEDRVAKRKRYAQLDPDGKYGSIEQYDSALDENPNLVKWVE